MALYCVYDKETGEIIQRGFGCPTAPRVNEEFDVSGITGRSEIWKVVEYSQRFPDDFVHYDVWVAVLSGDNPADAETDTS